MSLAGVLIAAGAIIHCIWAVITTYDLFAHSKRKLKILWLANIILLPAVGALLYQETKQRRRAQW